jgi:hypothetical protein
MIYIPKYTNIHVDLPQARAYHSGHFKFETFKTDSWDVEIPGSRRVRAEFDNIITNQGFDFLSDFGGIMNEVAVGTDDTPEAVGDTTLGFFIAGEATTTSDTFTAQGTAPYYGSMTNVWRFGEGDAEGILAEAGIGRGNCNIDGSDLWSRALIKDGAGDPTTVEVDANEWLDVTYQLRLYPGHLIDDTGSFLISGASHDYVMRNTFVTSGNLWGAYLASKFPLNAGAQNLVYEATSVLQTVDLAPTGTSAPWTGVPVAGSYSGGTYNQDATWELSLTAGNLTGGIAAATFFTGVGCVQMSFDPVVDKDATKLFDFTMNWAWGTRVVIP